MFLTLGEFPNLVHKQAWQYIVKKTWAYFSDFFLNGQNSFLPTLKLSDTPQISLCPVFEVLHDSVLNPVSAVISLFL